MKSTIPCPRCGELLEVFVGNLGRYVHKCSCGFREVPCLAVQSGEPLEVE